MSDLERQFQMAPGREFLPRVEASWPLRDESSLGALLCYPASADSLPQPPPFCFDNEWQPQYSPSLCEQPIRVKPLHMPVVTNARLLGQGVVIAQNDVILRESVGRHAARLGLEATGDETYRLSKQLKLATHRAQKRGVARHDCTGLLLFDPALHRFGMWILKCLTKLSILPLLDDPDIRVVVPSDVPDFYLALMEDLGIVPAKVVFHDPAGLSVFRQLIVPPKTYTFMSCRHGNPFEVFRYDHRPDRGESSRLLVRTDPKRRIYISRRQIERRKLANEPEVEQVFKEFGFHIIEPSGLTAAEVVSTFANCEFVAGPHGSGLYNVLFSRRKPKVLQLVPPGLKFENAFLITAHVGVCKGASGGFVFGRMLEDDRDRAGEFDYSWEVDLDRLRDVLTAAC